MYTIDCMQVIGVSHQNKLLRYYIVFFLNIKSLYFYINSPLRVIENQIKYTNARRVNPKIFFKPRDQLFLLHIMAIKLLCIVLPGGMAPPVDEWKKVMDDMNKGTAKLEEVYEQQLIQRKVRVYISIIIIN